MRLGGVGIYAQSTSGASRFETRKSIVGGKENTHSFCSFYCILGCWTDGYRYLLLLLPICSQHSYLFISLSSSTPNCCFLSNQRILALPRRSKKGMVAVHSTLSRYPVSLEPVCCCLTMPPCQQLFGLSRPSRYSLPDGLNHRRGFLAVVVVVVVVVVVLLLLLLRDGYQKIKANTRVITSEMIDARMTVSSFFCAPGICRLIPESDSRFQYFLSTETKQTKQGKV